MEVEFDVVYQFLSELHLHQHLWLPEIMVAIQNKFSVSSKVAYNLFIEYCEWYTSQHQYWLGGEKITTESIRSRQGLIS